MKGYIHMTDKWKLQYHQKHWKIHNESGKDLSYDPNSGIRILVDDGYAFKDVNRSGKIDAFEDWRLPMKQRVLDFTQRYHLVSEGNRIYYRKGFVDLPTDLLARIQESKQMQELMKTDHEFFTEHSALTILLLLFDWDNSMYFSDYIIQLFIDSLDTGVLDKVFYTIKKALYHSIGNKGELASIS